MVTTKIKKYNKDYYEKNLLKLKRFMRDYYKNHKEEIKLNQKLYSNTVKRQKDYNRPLKNVIREKIVEILEQREIKTILTLESSKFLFSKLIPNKKIIVFENNLEEYKRMEKRKPKNVNLFFGDISKFSELDSKVDMIYLDFCKTFEFSKETLFNLKEKIKDCKLFAITFCIFGGRGFEKLGDYQFELINKIQTLTEINWKVLYGEGYRDTSSMVTIVFENGTTKI